MWCPEIGIVESMEKIIVKVIFVFFVGWWLLEEIHVGIDFMNGLLLVEFGEGFAGVVKITENILDLALLFWGEGVELAEIAFYMHELKLYDNFKELRRDFFA